jgi:hypothetical protein
MKLRNLFIAAYLLPTFATANDLPTELAGFKLGQECRHPEIKTHTQESPPSANSNNIIIERDAGLNGRGVTGYRCGFFTKRIYQIYKGYENGAFDELREQLALRYGAPLKANELSSYWKGRVEPLGDVSLDIYNNVYAALTKGVRITINSEAILNSEIELRKGAEIRKRKNLLNSLR